MKQAKQFTSQEVDKARATLERALKEFERTTGLSASIGSIRYGTSMTMHLTIDQRIVSEDGKLFPATKESEDYKKLSSLPKEALFEEFVYQGDRYRIIGYSTRAKTMPIKYLMNDKPYKCSESIMRKVLKVACPEWIV